MAIQLVGFDADTGTLGNYFNANVQGCASITTAKAHNGTKSILYAPRDFPSMNNDLVMQTPNVFSGTGGNFANWTSSLNEIYLKFWWWMPSGITDSGAGAHAWRIYSGGAGSGIQLDCSTAASGNPSGGTFRWDLVILGAGMSNAMFTDYGTWFLTLPLDQWNEVKVHAILNNPVGTANGTLRSWVNGSLQFSKVGNIQLRATAAHTGWDAFALSTNYDPGVPHAGGDADWYSDELEIWDGVPSSDTTDPVCTITGPTAAATYSTAAYLQTISGTASDDTAVTSVTYSSSRGPSGTATGTTSWTFPIALQSGTNVITVTAHDAAGNTNDDVITITLTQSPILGQSIQ